MHVRHVSTRPRATFFLPGTKGTEIHESMKPREGETVIVKHDPNAFRETKLMEHLRERDIGRLVVMGMMTHMCVDSSTRAAADAGFACTLVHDACATRDLSFGGETVPAASVHNAFVAALSATFAKLLSAGEVRAAL